MNAINPTVLPPNGPGLLTLHSGQTLDLAAPESHQISAVDIAHSLARQDHYHGHSAGSEIYSEAQHSFLMAAYLSHATHDAETALHGLMCNASKAFTGTLSPAVEAMLDASSHHFADLQATLQRTIYQALDLPALSIKQAHWVLIARQQTQLIELGRAPANIPDSADLIDCTAQRLTGKQLMNMHTVDDQQQMWLAAYRVLSAGGLIHG